MLAWWKNNQWDMEKNASWEEEKTKIEEWKTKFAHILEEDVNLELVHRVKGIYDRRNLQNVASE